MDLYEESVYWTEESARRGHLKYRLTFGSGADKRQKYFASKEQAQEFINSHISLLADPHLVNPIPRIQYHSSGDFIEVEVNFG